MTRRTTLEKHLATLEAGDKDSMVQDYPDLVRHAAELECVLEDVYTALLLSSGSGQALSLLCKRCKELGVKI